MGTEPYRQSPQEIGHVCMSTAINKLCFLDVTSSQLFIQQQPYYSSNKKQ